MSGHARTPGEAWAAAVGAALAEAGYVRHPAPFSYTFVPWPPTGRVADGGCTDTTKEVQEMADEVQAQDSRLRLKRSVKVLHGESSIDSPYGYGHRLIWYVEGVAGAVGLTVDLGGFRSGHAEDMARELMAYELRRDTDDDESDNDTPNFAYVNCGLAARAVYAHAARPWPEGGSDDGDPSCALLGQPCYAKQILGEYQPELHGLLVHLVQPGGPEHVYEKLEAMYRDVFDARPSQVEEGRRTAAEATALATARAEGAARAAGEAVVEARDMHREAQTVERGAMSPTDKPGMTAAGNKHVHRGPPQATDAMVHPDDSQAVADLAVSMHANGRTAPDIVRELAAMVGLTVE